MSKDMQILYSLYRYCDSNFFDDYVENVHKRVKFQKLGNIFACIFDIHFGSFYLYYSGIYNSDFADMGYHICERKNKYEKDIIELNSKVYKILDFIKENILSKDLKFLEDVSTYCYLKYSDREKTIKNWFKDRKIKEIKNTYDNLMKEVLNETKN